MNSGRRASDSRELLPGARDLPGHLFWRATARVSAALGEVLPAGVDIHAYAALLALSGGVTRSQQSLADTISVSRTTMVRGRGRPRRRRAWSSGCATPTTGGPTP